MIDTTIQSSAETALMIRENIGYSSTPGSPPKMNFAPFEAELDFGNRQESVGILSAADRGLCQVALKLPEDRVLVLPIIQLSNDYTKDGTYAFEDPAKQRFYENDERTREIVIASQKFEEIGLLTCRAEPVHVKLPSSQEPCLAYVSPDFHSFKNRNIYVIDPNTFTRSTTWHQGEINDDAYRHGERLPKSNHRSFFHNGVDKKDPNTWKPLLSEFINDLEKMAKNNVYPAPAKTSRLPNSHHIAVITNEEGKVQNLRTLFFDKVMTDELIEHDVINYTKAFMTRILTYEFKVVDISESLVTALVTHCLTSLNEKLGQQIVEFPPAQTTPQEMPTPKPSSLPPSTWERICSWVSGFFAWIGSLFQGVFSNN